MQKIIQNIFSVKNEKIHKVWTIFGVKFKFQNKFKLTVNEFNRIEKQNQELKKQLNNVNNLCKNFNNKCKKDFIIDNLDNPNFYELQQDIYNFYNEMTSRKFYTIFQCRLSKSLIIKGLDKCFNKIKKQIYVLTDIQNFPKNYSVITKDEIDSLKNQDCVVVLVYNNDFSALEMAKYLKLKNISYMSLMTPYPLARYFHTDKEAFETLLDESSNNNWHFCPGDFENIFQALKTTKDLEGDFVEIGTFKGDSGSAALNYMKRADINKKAYFFDTFEGFDYEDAYKSEDIYWQGTHTDTSLENVKKRFSKYNNAAVTKLNIITDELPCDIEKICVANIDVDMYEAVKTALYKVKDKVVTNGIIICEDYGHTPALLGAQRGVKEFLDENKGKFLEIYLPSGQMFLIKR